MANSSDLTSSCAEIQQVDLGFVELSWLQIAVLGVIQGVTELLPISSTAHLRVIPGILGWRDPGSAFSAAMQLASFVAVVVYFRKDIGTLGAAGVRAVRDARLSRRATFGCCWEFCWGRSLTALRCAAAADAQWLPLAAAGLARRGHRLDAMSLLLGLAEKTARHRRKFSDITLKDGIIVGIAQAFALVPGVSRSGATLTAGLFCGMERETAARFSFLLGLPAITLAGLFELRVLFKAGLSSQGWLTLSIGLLFASVTAFIAIYGLLHYLERRSTWIFVWYRFVFGAGIVAAVAAGYLHN